MVSPSSVIRRRTVPCIAGCEGPRLMVISDEGSSASTASGSRSASSALSSISVIGGRVHVRPPHVRLAHGDVGAARPRAGPAHQVGEIQLGDQRLPLLRRVILAQWMADEFGIEQYPLQIGMTLELN